MYLQELKRGRLTSFFLKIFTVLLLLIATSSLFAQGDMTFDEKEVGKFVFGATSAKIDPHPKIKLDPKQNFITLEGDNATLYLNRKLNDKLRKNRFAGIYYHGEVTGLEIFKKKNLIEISFVLNTESTKIRVEIKFWDDLSSSAVVQPLNTNIPINLNGNMYKKGSLAIQKFNGK